VTSVNPGLPVVTNPATIATSMITNLERDQSSIAALETEVSTGFAVNTPADSPGEAANIVSLQASITRASQYQTNAQDGIGWLNTANSTMNSVIGLLQQVRSVVLGISSADLSQGQAGLNAVADQVTSSLQELVGLANTQYAGQAIFSGTGNPHAAYDPAACVLVGAFDAARFGVGALFIVRIVWRVLFGEVRWTTPSGRQYTTEPTRYPI